MCYTKIRSLFFINIILGTIRVTRNFLKTKKLFAKLLVRGPRYCTVGSFQEIKNANKSRDTAFLADKGDGRIHYCSFCLINNLSYTPSTINGQKLLPLKSSVNYQWNLLFSNLCPAMFVMIYQIRTNTCFFVILFIIFPICTTL